MKKFDYIVVGGGLAGLYTAYVASAHGSVALITKESLRDSNSYNAQGGIAAVTAASDAPHEHYLDTLEAGRGLCDEAAVRILTEEAPARISELIAWGMRFDLEKDGALALGLEGGHHQHRILHAGGDATGRLVTSFMIDEVLETENIEIFVGHQAVELLLNDEGVCCGVCTWDWANGYFERFLGRNTIMATGGSAAIYQRSTNPRSTLGDGIAMCYQAGCTIRDMEFVQFHPTALYQPNSPDAFLISEAVRGEGAHLLNAHGERFMLGVHPLAELAARDIVARSIFMEIMKDGKDFVTLSLKHLDPERIKMRFPTIYNRCKSLDLDLTDSIPVAPAAHYTVGGVACDLNGQSSVPRLYVVGELASSGIMGANRLASNSLIECLVFGHRVVQDSLVERADIDLSSYKPNKIGMPKDIGIYEKIKAELATLLMSHAGIIRNETGLSYAHAEIEKMEQSLASERGLYSHFAKQLLTIGKLIVSSALARKESRGGHYRDDYPSSQPECLKHTLCSIHQDTIA